VDFEIGLPEKLVSGGFVVIEYFCKSYNGIQVQNLHQNLCANAVSELDLHEMAPPKCMISMDADSVGSKRDRAIKASASSGVKV
jgi:hypothetical protein